MMLRNAGLPPLADRRRMQRLILFYKVVEGKVPALPFHEFLTPIRNKRKVRARDLSDFEHTHFVSTYAHNNSRGFKVDTCKTTNYKQSFFIRTTIDWNNLEDDVVKCPSVETFKTAIDRQCC
jgi:hypothetical protein